MRKAIVAAVAALLLSTGSENTLASSVPSFLDGSVFYDNYLKTDIDPLLLYSISLAESAYKRDQSSVGPYRYAIQHNGKSYYPPTKQEASAILDKLLKSGAKNIDVGFMQVNLLWNGDRVESPHDLFDTITSINVASEILLEAMHSSPDDIKVAIGRYHTWNDPVRGMVYANRVLRIYTNINKYYRKG